MSVIKSPLLLPGHQKWLHYFSDKEPVIADRAPEMVTSNVGEEPTATLSVIFERAPDTELNVSNKEPVVAARAPEVVTLCQ
jgi:hypothetical protein